MDKMDKTNQTREGANPDAFDGGTDDHNSRLDLIGDGEYMIARIACPNCGGVAKTPKIKSNEPYEARNVRCRKKCGIDGFDWHYEPQKVGDRYTYMNSSASVSADNMPKMKIYNERRNFLSNK
ncbi:MAG: hypothetical protein ABSC29_01560 [Minisyncoccia bacterium]|jgi:hypothetical protein